jgi:hypothetical protein
MGEHADDIIDSMMDSWDNFSDYRRIPNFQKGVGNYMWRQGNLEIIDMHNMSNDHLANAIKICEKRRNTAKKKQLEEVLRDRFI